jgi:hypothetical protein
MQSIDNIIGTAKLFDILLPCAKSVQFVGNQKYLQIIILKTKIKAGSIVNAKNATRKNENFSQVDITRNMVMHIERGPGSEIVS